MNPGEPNGDASPEPADTGSDDDGRDHGVVGGTSLDLSEDVVQVPRSFDLTDGVPPEWPAVEQPAAVEPAAPTDDLAPAGSSEPALAEPARSGGGRHRAAKTKRGGRGKSRAGDSPKRKAPWWELPALIVAAVLIAIGVKSFVIQPFYIPSESMEHTLYGCSGCSGDRILVFKPVYWFRDPEPGDIVVFNAPPGWDSEPTSKPPSNIALRTVRGFGQLVGVVPPDGEVLVKRVIAVGGQTVKGDAAGHVFISNHGPGGPYRELIEPYVFNDPPSSGRTNPAFGPVTVPKGRLWVMGDHRTDSADSRYHCSPGGGAYNDLDCDATSSTVPIDNVIGKAIVIAWPPSRWTTLGTPSTFDSAAAAGASGVAPLGVVVPLFLVRRRRRRR